MPIFVERFVLPILASTVVGLIILNPLKLDRLQQWSLAIAVISIAFFIGRTLDKKKDEGGNNESGSSSHINLKDQLLMLQGRVSGREISEKQTTEFVSFAKNKPKGVVVIQRLTQDPEAVAYSHKIYDLLHAGGWTPLFPPGKTMGVDPGLRVSVYSSEQLPDFRDKGNTEALTPSSPVFRGKVLKDSFDAAKIPVNGYVVKSGPPIPRDSVYIAIGQKP